MTSTRGTLVHRLAGPDGATGHLHVTFHAELENPQRRETCSGGAMFFTDYSMSAMELARALEERGFESVWAPEHSHIPLSRKTPFPGGGDLPKQYYTLTL
jgi:alkanesulfonate monooxygenase SsuD/methylene tetrahydromethanopterin reductase-like flavin-dependent oxidoreductase (luciferase family)